VWPHNPSGHEHSGFSLLLWIAAPLSPRKRWRSGPRPAMTMRDMTGSK